MLSGAKHLQYLLENNPLQVLRSPENRTDDVIPAKAGIQFFRTWTPACAGVTTLIFIPSGGPQAHGNSVESHVIPAKAGIHLTWVPAFAGTTTYVTFRSMGGPRAHGPSGRQPGRFLPQPFFAIWRRESGAIPLALELIAP